MRVTLIINPYSGKRDTAAKLAAIHRACRDLKVRYQALVISTEEPLSRLTDRVLRERPDRLLVCGGDGTVTQVGEALLHSDIPIGIIAGGTANSIARALGVPVQWEEATRFLLTHEPRPFDAMRINDRTSLLISGAGYDSDVIATADPELKRRVGVLAYVWSGLLQLGALNETTFEVTVDDRPMRAVSGHCLLIANIGKLFGEFDLFRDTEPDDGVMNVAVLTLGDLAEFISLSGRALAGIQNPDHRSAFFTGSKVKVRFSRKLRSQIDGDVGGELDHMDAEILPAALRVVRSTQEKKPIFQVPSWIVEMADSLMGMKEIERLPRRGTE